ncbi:RNA-binding transcriptional accessory protein [Rossellomorea vietnamensis]|uniref:RNA-binding transcriptional accessory protein n=1 Tax=Rossellomorea vietnamensis TaxID=218284 RepID=A0A5D4K7P2_9BACI|nr:Tex family protein [Rossellomorea vietnamensis]TYR73381.1 RNA-binding transcriptional accessory protein [Rossellomorea vietnamensis]
MSLLKEKPNLIEKISKDLAINIKQIKSVISLLDEGNTVPFIARYRKEQTGALDEVQIRAVMDAWNYVQNLQSRKEEVLRLIEEQGKLTPELKNDIEKADKLQKVEDLYRPYKQKRRTKATVAKEKGLEPLAEWMLTFPVNGNLESEAEKYVSVENEINSAEDAIAGAQDIIAELVSDDAKFREWIRNDTFKTGTLVTSVKKDAEDEKNVFEMYYDYSEPVNKIVPHRVLAVNRGEKEGILKVSIEPNAERIHNFLVKNIIKKESTVSQSIEQAIEDSYKRLIQPSIEREIRNSLTETAEDRAIHIFTENLRNLLLQPPLKGKRVLGVDPAYRTGCKLAVVDQTGKMLDISVIYPHPPKAKKEAAVEVFKKTLQTYNIEIVAIGNGTASRETEQFVVDILKDVNMDISYLIVNEAGASVYSASDIAREEFPDLQVEERSAVSIARRLQDPLAELVKIDPRSVGVGQYQHDVSQKKLNESLTFVVETVVNQVGVNVNTASSSLLQYVAGLSKTVANNIVKQREEEGRINSRKQLKKIPRLGAKTYEQCIGFLRIMEGEEALDQTPIHPENYEEVRKLLRKLDLDGNSLGTEELRKRMEGLNLEELSEELGIGKLTLKDIVDALVRPGRDPRDELSAPLLKKDVLKLEDLQPGMELQGTVRNVVDFGAFVDIGVKQDGLVHISKLRKGFVKHPLDVVSVGDVVTVWVESADVKKGRVALSMVKE